MKEFEEFAKVISLGMKALAKMIDTAADQLEKHAQFDPEETKAQQSRASSGNRSEAGKNSGGKENGDVKTRSKRNVGKRKKRATAAAIKTTSNTEREISSPEMPKNPAPEKKPAPAGKMEEGALETGTEKSIAARTKSSPRRKTKEAKPRKPSTRNPNTGNPGMRKGSDTHSVYLHIQAAKEDIHIDQIEQQTGFAKKKLHNILHRLKKSGKIRNTAKSVYTVE